MSAERFPKLLPGGRTLANKKWRKQVGANDGGSSAAISPRERAGTGEQNKFFIACRPKSFEPCAISF